MKATLAKFECPDCSVRYEIDLSRKHKKNSNTQIKFVCAYCQHSFEINVSTLLSDQSSRHNDTNPDPISLPRPKEVIVASDLSDRNITKTPLVIDKNPVPNTQVTNPRYRFLGLLTGAIGIFSLILWVNQRTTITAQKNPIAEETYQEELFTLPQPIDEHHLSMTDEYTDEQETANISTQNLATKELDLITQQGWIMIEERSYYAAINYFTHVINQEPNKRAYIGLGYAEELIADRFKRQQNHSRAQQRYENARTNYCAAMKYFRSASMPTTKDLEREYLQARLHMIGRQCQ